MKTLSFWKKSLYSALIFFGTLIVLSVGYATWNTAMSKVNSGNPLTATAWNALVDNIADIDSRWSRAGGNIVFTGGNVGIGTTSWNPYSARLAVYSNSAYDQIMTLRNTNAAGLSSIRLEDNNGNYVGDMGYYNLVGSTGIRIGGNGTIDTFFPTGNVYMGATWAGTATGGNQFLNAPAGAYQIIGHPSSATSGYSYSIFQWNGVTIGNIAQNGTTSVAYNTTSDKRLKENFVKPTKTLEELDKINVYKYNYKADPAKTQQMGFIAQELYDIYPQAVTVGGDDPKTHPWSVDYSKVVPLLTSGIQELKKENDAMKTRNNELEKRLEAIEKELAEQK